MEHLYIQYTCRRVLLSIYIASAVDTPCLLPRRQERGQKEAKKSQRKTATEIQSNQKQCGDRSHSPDVDRSHQFGTHMYTQVYCLPSTAVLDLCIQRDWDPS